MQNFEFLASLQNLEDLVTINAEIFHVNNLLELNIVCTL